MENHREFFDNPNKYTVSVTRNADDDYTVTANYDFDTSDPLNARNYLERSGSTADDMHPDTEHDYAAKRRKAEEAQKI